MLRTQRVCTCCRCAGTRKVFGRGSVNHQKTPGTVGCTRSPRLVSPVLFSKAARMPTPDDMIKYSCIAHRASHHFGTFPVVLRTSMEEPGPPERRRGSRVSRSCSVPPMSVCFGTYQAVPLKAPEDSALLEACLKTPSLALSSKKERNKLQVLRRFSRVRVRFLNSNHSATTNLLLFPKRVPPRILFGGICVPASMR